MATVTYDQPTPTPGKKKAPSLQDRTTNAAQSPQGQDPFTAMGGGQWTGSGWVPKDHPLAQGGGGGGGTAPPPSPPASGAMPPAPPAAMPLQQQPVEQQRAMPTMRTPQEIAAYQATHGGYDPTAIQDAQLAAQGQPTTGPGITDASAAPPAGAPPTTANPFASHPAGGVWIPSTQQWVPGDHPLAQTAGAQPTPPGTTTPPGETPPAGIEEVAAPPPPGTLETIPPAIEIDEAVDPADEAFKAALIELLGQDPNDVSLTDADIAPQQRAMEAAIQRQALQDRAALMERSSAEGIADSEAVRASGRTIGQQAARDIGAADAGFLREKMQARRDQLNQAMQIANARGMQQEANDLAREIANLDAELKTREQGLTREGMQLTRDLATLDTNTKQYLADLDARLRREGYSTQERLAQLDAEVRKYGIDTQGNIGQLELALRRELGIGELNLGLLQTLFQNEQAGNRLGFDIGSFQSGLNRDALIAAPGGG